MDVRSSGSVTKKKPPDKLAKMHKELGSALNKAIFDEIKMQENCIISKDGAIKSRPGPESSLKDVLVDASKSNEGLKINSCDGIISKGYTSEHNDLGKTIQDLGNRKASESTTTNDNSSAGIINLEKNSGGHVTILENVLLDNISDKMDTESECEYEEGFYPVQNKRYKRNARGDVSRLNFGHLKTNDRQPEIGISSNRFAILGDLDLEPQTHNQPKNANLNQKKKVEVKGRVSFCPPIFLFNVHIGQLMRQLKEKNIVFRIVNKNRFKSKLYLEDAKVHSEMMDILRQKKVESYTYTPKEYKKVSLVLRGLFYATDLNDIKEDLELNVPNTVEQVTKFITGHSKKNNIDSNLFLITLFPGKSLSDISHVRYVLDQRISWESIKSNRKPVQCWRCQIWGHFSKNCSRTPACVKCNESHEPGKCNFVRTVDSEPYCVNCKSFGHPSNYRRCPAYREYVLLKEKIRTAAEKRRNEASEKVFRTVTRASTLRPNISFADVTKGNSKSVSSGFMPPIVREFLRISQTLCEPQPLTLEQKLEHFIRNYESLTKEEAKIQCVELLSEVKTTYGP